MKYSTRLSDAVHILTLIALNESPTLSSGAIAESIHTNPSYVRQFMAKLKKSGLINSYQGQAVPALSRKAEEITLLEIYKAVEGDKPLLHLDTHTNPLCQVGVNIQLALQEYYVPYNTPECDRRLSRKASNAFHQGGRMIYENSAN